ncbi:uncharacterized protein [Ptychodera flava]|uniref:uncharacterized protein n=1 Tax=Ptychodera flava TaxID=63121 RepID=UPI00396A87E3
MQLRVVSLRAVDARCCCKVKPGHRMVKTFTPYNVNMAEKYLRKNLRVCILLCGLLDMAFGQFPVASLTFEQSKKVVKSGDDVSLGCQLITYPQQHTIIKLRFPDYEEPREAAFSTVEQTDNMVMYSTLITKSMNENTTGWYTCQAILAPDTVIAESKTVELAVYDLVKSDDIYVQTGDNTTLFCNLTRLNVEGETITRWFKNGIEMNTTSSEDIWNNTVTNVDTLVLNYVDMTDTGIYRCIIDFRYNGDEYTAIGDIIVTVNSTFEHEDNDVIGGSQFGAHLQSSMVVMVILHLIICIICEYFRVLPGYR